MKGFLSLVTVVCLAILVILAYRGEVAAIAALAVIVSVALVLVGVGISIAVQYAAARRDQQQFAQNARENLAIMSKMQGVQNQQNAMLLKQAREAGRLAPPGGDIIDIDALVMDDDVFAELED